MDNQSYGTMGLKLTDLIIDPEFRALLPQGSDDEREKLLANIRADGRFTAPLIVWHRIIVDGMTRFDFWCNELECSKDIYPEIVEMEFKSRDEAKAWMIRHQAGRRNLSPSQLAMMAAILATLDSSDGRAQICARDLKSAASELNVSRRSAGMAKNILAIGSQSLKDAVTNGAVKVSDAAKIVTLPEPEQTAAVDAVKSGQFKTVAGAAKSKTKAEPKEIEPGDETENEPIDPEAERLKNLVGAKPKPERPSVDKTLTTVEKAAQQSKMLELFCRTVSKFFEDNLPSDPWLDESQVDIARGQLKSCLGAIRVAKACDKNCPKCSGKGCKHCRQCGYLPKLNYEMLGGK